MNISDLREARRFPDVVVHKAQFVVDIHNPVGGGQANGIAEYVDAYDIPWRSLVPQKMENLILAGRCSRERTKPWHLTELWQLPWQSVKQRESVQHLL